MPKTVIDDHGNHLAMVMVSIPSPAVRRLWQAGVNKLYKLLEDDNDHDLEQGASAVGAMQQIEINKRL